MPRHFVLALLVAMSATAGPPAHAQHSDHSAAVTTHPSRPTEPGNGAFAAISEIVALLMSDPETDWSDVDMTALRAHLVDMDALVMDADVATQPIEGGVRMALSRQGRGGAAADRMVPAQAPVLAAATGWSSHTSSKPDTVIWTVTGSTDADTSRIRALGFYGLMAVGDHHRAHHLAIARGLPAH